MLLACKYEEVYVPVVADVIVISDKAYTRKEVLEMEEVMVNTLKFNISVPAAYVFMKRFLKAAQADRKVIRKHLSALEIYQDLLQLRKLTKENVDKIQKKVMSILNDGFFASKDYVPTRRDWLSAAYWDWCWYGSACLG